MHTRGRVVATLAALVAALAAAFVLAPPRLATNDPNLADPQRLSAAFRAALVDYWGSGDLDYPPELRRLIGYWLRFHLIKGGIAVLLLAVLVALAVSLWRTRQRADRLGRGSRVALVSAATAAPLLALAALAAAMANVQGAVAPFASLLPMLIDGPSDARLADTLAQARHHLAGSHRTTGYTPPALDAMVGDFTRYHVALAVVAAVAVVALLTLSVVFWRRCATAGSADRRVLAGFAVFLTLSSLILTVVCTANAGTAMDPAPALLALLDGGY